MTVFFVCVCGCVCVISNDFHFPFATSIIIKIFEKKQICFQSINGEIFVSKYGMEGTEGLK